MRSTVKEIDREADDHPDDQSLPRCDREARHHVAANQNSQNGDQRHHRRTKWPREIRGLVAENYDARAYDDESEQSPDRDQLAEQADWKETRNNPGNDTGKDRRDVRRFEARVNLPEHRRQ